MPDGKIGITGVARQGAAEESLTLHRQSGGPAHVFEALSPIPPPRLTLWHSRGYPVSTPRQRVLTDQRRASSMAKDFSLKPLEDRIVVKPSEGEETTTS